MDAAFVLNDRSDQELLDSVWAAVRRETENVAVVIAHIAEIEKRNIFPEDGFGSLKGYCMEALHFSEDQTYTRIGVARIARKFPVVLEMLADGLVHLTAVLRLGPSLTEENHVAILDEATYKTMDDVEKLVARLRPKGPVATTIRKVSRTETSPAQRDFVDPSDDSTPSEVEEEPEKPEFYRKKIVSPIAPDLYDFHFTGDGEMADALKLLQELLSHRVPNGPVIIMKDALLMRLKQVQRQRYGKGRRKKKSSTKGREAAAGSTGVVTSAAGAGAVSAKGSVDLSEIKDADEPSRYIPDDVKEAVWERDKGRCAFISKKGRWCTERRFLEFHHIIPFAWNGPTTVDNLELRCRTHNAYEGELLFGKVMRKQALSLRSGRFKTSGSLGKRDQPGDRG